MVKLGVNVDHVATLREARKAAVPGPVEAAIACERAGCDSIVCHLREDRRHIKDRDVERLARTVRTRLNLEMSAAPEIVRIARSIRPSQATLVPENRREVTTEGGLDVMGGLQKIKRVVSALADSGIETSLFIDPSKRQIDASLKCGARIVELHTGEYANAATARLRAKKLAVLKSAAGYAVSKGLEVNAGHGLDYVNVAPVASIKGMNELNIGHSIISRAIFVGIGRAVGEMLEIIR